LGCGIRGPITSLDELLDLPAFIPVFVGFIRLVIRLTKRVAGASDYFSDEVCRLRHTYVFPFCICTEAPVTAPEKGKRKQCQPGCRGFPGLDVGAAKSPSCRKNSLFGTA
jgi:hypothetical protein